MRPFPIEDRDVPDLNLARELNLEPRCETMPLLETKPVGGVAIPAQS